MRTEIICLCVAADKNWNNFIKCSVDVNKELLAWFLAQKTTDIELFIELLYLQDILMSYLVSWQLHKKSSVLPLKIQEETKLISST